MTVALTNITGGPAQLQVDTVRLSHTQGGVGFKIGPKNRMRTVDQYGVTSVDVLHQGDDVRVTAPLAEWTAEVLAKIYNPGNDQTAAVGAKWIGIGRSAGFIYTDFELLIIPLLTADSAKRAQFWRCTPVGEFEIKHTPDDDRVFSTEWACMADPAGSGSTDGQLIGKIQLAAS